MRIAGLLLAISLIACSSNPGEPSGPDPQLGPVADPSVGAVAAPTDPVADPDNGAVAATPAAPSVPHAGDDIELGTAVMIEPDKTYRVRGTELTIEQRGASMASASDGEGNDFHYIMADIVLTMGGEQMVVAMAGGQPTEWKGFRVTIDELGFSYSASEVNVLVERIE